MRLGRYCIASFIVDGAFYVLWTVLPFRALELGADSFQLGLLPVITGTTYILGSITFGWLSDRVPHVTLMRAGVLTAGSGMLLLVFADALDDLFTLAPIASIGTSMFWPTIQAAIGRESDSARLDRSLGVFNVSWSAGKALGFYAGGLLLAGAGAEATLKIAAFSTWCVILFVPWREFSRASAPPDPVDPARPSAFMRAAWIGNFAAFGVSNILNVHYPEFLTSALMLTDSKQTFGFFLGAVFVAQTLAFLWLLTSSWWTYRWMPILALTAVMGGSVGFLPEAGQITGMLLSAAPIGLGLGMAYSASIYYSLHGPRMKGLKAGIHEGIIGSAGVACPLVAGWLAHQTGDLRWPYWTAASIAAGALVLQAISASLNKTPSSPVPRA